MQTSLTRPIKRERFSSLLTGKLGFPLFPLVYQFQPKFFLLLSFLFFYIELWMVTPIFTLGDCCSSHSAFGACLSF